ncbi:hypothetical protein [Microbacterium thalli]|uniref:Uncharacterized protein n=1 Tax=Microbacterium thalli TaxID=3027921 RepID=A0ABT5SKB0_9MICO|nr:hypothetical protein [Microbacterium thalli]MDD7962915.1 hypothetical protein [Microbacterium thalli]MDN8548592.1 hypothetical protein [Microbacterium thalli]
MRTRRAGRPPGDHEGTDCHAIPGQFEREVADVVRQQTRGAPRFDEVGRHEDHGDIAVIRLRDPCPRDAECRADALPIGELDARRERDADDDLRAWPTLEHGVEAGQQGVHISG